MLSLLPFCQSVARFIDLMRSCIASRLFWPADIVHVLVMYVCSIAVSVVWLAFPQRCDYMSKLFLDTQCVIMTDLVKQHMCIFSYMYMTIPRLGGSCFSYTIFFVPPRTRVHSTLWMSCAQQLFNIIFHHPWYCQLPQAWKAFLCEQPSQVLAAHRSKHNVNVSQCVYVP